MHRIVGENWSRLKAWRVDSMQVRDEARDTARQIPGMIRTAETTRSILCDCCRATLRDIARLSAESIKRAVPRDKRP